MVTSELALCHAGAKGPWGPRASRGVRNSPPDLLEIPWPGAGPALGQLARGWGRRLPPHHCPAAGPRFFWCLGLPRVRCRVRNWLYLPIPKKPTEQALGYILNSAFRPFP